MDDNKHIDGQVTDLTYLKSLSKGDMQFVERMIGIFLKENPQEIRSLEKCIGEKNYSGIRSWAHKLKSSTPFVGLNNLVATKLVEMERLAIDQSGLERIQQLFSDVKKVCSKAWSELETKVA